MTLLWLAAAACAVAYWAQVLSPPDVLRSLVKTLSVALLALIAAVMWQGALALALAFCAVGDALLSRPGERAFALGIAAFAAGHLAYVSLFLTQPGADLNRLLNAPQAFAVIGLLALGATLALRILPATGALRIPVALYIPIILSMSLAALSLSPSPATGLILLGAALFLLSDSLLAVETFLLKDGMPLARALARIVWPSYWAAQALFLAGFTGIPAA
ncbi:lysoplasmalogenase [Aestuariivita boseongensis]|uniref:lysoplasmalogenase n=1 Tax=Aestuariivita boseongensis TaxID=1470562 RepID=UPI000681B812|nr:lysoplasmalogenase [Aestuariivita boseongensis]